MDPFQTKPPRPSAPETSGSHRDGKPAAGRKPFASAILRTLNRKVPLKIGIFFMAALVIIDFIVNYIILRK